MPEAIAETHTPAPAPTRHVTPGNYQSCIRLCHLLLGGAVHCHVTPWYHPGVKLTSPRPRPMSFVVCIRPSDCMPRTSCICGTTSASCSPRRGTFVHHSQRRDNSLGMWASTLVRVWPWGDWELVGLLQGPQLLPSCCSSLKLSLRPPWPMMGFPFLTCLAQCRASWWSLRWLGVTLYFALAIPLTHT